MKSTLLALTLAATTACSALHAQTMRPTGITPRSSQGRQQAGPPKPFSVVALGGGISAMGINIQATTNVNRFMNLRAVGNQFNYSLNNINTNGFNVNGKLNLATAGASLDFYPFPAHGLRLSPGMLFLNNNAASATMTASAGTSFTLNDTDYYSSASDPVSGVASLGLNTNKKAATMTIGWGNQIPRYSKRHFSFPVEVGAAFIGQPTVNLALTSGQVCSDPQGTANCQNVAGDPTLNANVQAQIAKYQKDLDPFKYYPIVSFGVAYNFHIRRSGL